MSCDKYTTLFANTAIFAFGNIVSKVILSLLLPLYTRTLTTSEYGVAELITTISQLVIPVVSLAIGDAVFRYSINANNAKNALKNASYVVFFASIGLAIVSIGLYKYEPVSKWVVSFFLMSTLILVRSILSLYTKAIGKTLCFAMDSIIYNFCLMIFNFIFLLILKTQLKGYFDSIIFANIISILFLSCSNKVITILSNAKYSAALLKNMLTYSAPLILNSIMWGLTNVVNRIMLTNTLSSSATGIYSAASKIPSIITLVTGVFTQAWSLSAINDYESEKDHRFYENIFNGTHITVIILTGSLLSINNMLFPVVMGKDFVEAVRYIPVLFLGTVFLTYSNYCSPLFSAMKDSKDIMISAVFGCVTNIVLNVVLIPKLGILGACIATMIAYLVIATYRLFLINKLFKLEIEYAKFIFTIILVSIATVCATFNKRDFVTSISVIAICCVMYRNCMSIFLKNLVDYTRRKLNAK